MASRTPRSRWAFILTDAAPQTAAVWREHLNVCFQVDEVDSKVVKVSKNILPCTLDDATKNLIELIFSNDMFKEAMECMNLGG